MEQAQLPNLQTLAKAIKTVADEMALVPNQPLSSQNWYIVDLLRQTLCWQMQIIDELQESWVFPILDCSIRTHSFTSQRLLPMRLYNATAGQFASLRYPTGIDTTGLPATRGEFFNLTGRFSTTIGEYGHC